MEVESQERQRRPMPVSSAGLGDGFTEADLAAADQLVQLSASGGGDEDEAASPSSSSLSARSVNNADAAAAAAARDEDDEDGVASLDRRARKRYRRVADVYDATRLVKCGAMRRGEDRETGKR